MLNTKTSLLKLHKICRFQNCVSETKKSFFVFQEFFFFFSPTFVVLCFGARTNFHRSSRTFRSNREKTEPAEETACARTVLVSIGKKWSNDLRRRKTLIFPTRSMHRWTKNLVREIEKNEYKKIGYWNKKNRM